MITIREMNMAKQNKILIIQNIVMNDIIQPAALEINPEKIIK